MNIGLVSPIILLATTAILALTLSLYALRWQGVPGGLYFCLLMFSVAVYAFCDAAELSSTAIQAKIIWATISSLGVVNLAPLWLLFAVSFGNRSVWWEKYRYLLWIIPVATAGMVFTNGWHGLIWPSIQPDSSEPGARLVYTHGLLFWLHAAYAYGLMAVGTFEMVRHALHSTRFYRRQDLIIILCALFPWLANLLYLLNIVPSIGVDFTPIAFLLTGLLSAWAFSRYHLFEITPVARDVMFENLGDGVLILDLQNRILDLNPVARLWMGLEGEVIGQNVFSVTHLDPSAFQNIKKIDGHTQTQLVLGQNRDRRVYDLNISPVRDQSGQLKCNLVLLHDISIEKYQNDQLKTIQSVSQAVASSLEISEICATVVDMLHETFGYEFTSIYYLRKNILILGAQAGYSPAQAYYEIPTDKGILGRTVRSRSAQLIQDVRLDPDYLNAADEVSCEICVPVIKNQQVLGILNVESPNAGQLNEMDVGLLTTVANQVAIAMMNANLFLAERTQRELNEALREISVSLSESLDLNTLLDRMLGEIRRVIPYDSACVFLTDKTCIQASVARLSGYEQYGETIRELRASQALKIAQTPHLKEMAETGKPVVISDTLQNPGWISLPGSIHILSWIGVPILIHGKMTAFFALEKKEAGFFRPEHSSRLSTFAAQAAIAIENARLHEAEKQKNQRLEALYSAASMLISTLELDPLLEQILLAAVRTVPASGQGTLLLVDEEKHLLRVNNHAGYRSAEIENVIFDLDGSGYAVQAVRKRQPLLIDDIGQNDGLEYLGNNLEVKRIRSGVVAPLIYKDEVLGAISIDSTQPGTFTEDDLQLLVGLASIATIALRNARQHQNVQQLSITDPLTGCYNRRGLFELGRHEISRIQRGHSSLAALMIDVDNFKEINDQYGHLLGDQVLQQVAAEIRREGRSSDIIGRYGGDEFVVLLPDTGLEEARAVAERLREHISQVNFQGNIRLTVSEGLGLMDNDCPDLLQLIARADHAVFHSKVAGRNRVSIP